MLFGKSGKDAVGVGKDYSRLFRVALWYSLRRPVGKLLIIEEQQESVLLTEGCKDLSLVLVPSLPYRKSVLGGLFADGANQRHW